MVAATLAAILTTWVTFIPCFLWIFLGAPFIEQLRGNVALTGAMSAITAAVAGVILNLAVWFALHRLFADNAIWKAGPLSIDVPVLGSIVLASLLLSIAAALAVFRFKASVIVTLLACAFAGMACTLMSAVAWLQRCRSRATGLGMARFHER
ncbi:hypothetical protein CPY51_24030 [Rhizobium tubonense]|uniref:Chromate transporter n=1 Tax=Rhizobium tubonense TaxID=484088 RepID=A0A2W4E2W4_9HYPH|nr:hypothetical protein CPY51_24030 [Rhizobium tubonense]